MKWIQKTIPGGEVAVFVDDETAVKYKLIRSGFLWRREDGDGQEYVELDKLKIKCEDEWYRMHPRVPDAQPNDGPAPPWPAVEPAPDAIVRGRRPQPAARMGDFVLQAPAVRAGWDAPPIFAQPGQGVQQF